MPTSSSSSRSAERRTEPIGSLAPSVAASRAVRAAGSGQRPSLRAVAARTPRARDPRTTAGTDDPHPDRRRGRTRGRSRAGTAHRSACSRSPTRSIRRSTTRSTARRSAGSTRSSAAATSSRAISASSATRSGCRSPTSAATTTAAATGLETSSNAPQPLASGSLVEVDGHHRGAVRMARAAGRTRRRATSRAPGWTSSGSRGRWSCAACAGGARRSSCSATPRRAGWGTARPTRITSGSRPTAGCSSASGRRSGSTATRRRRPSPTGATSLGDRGGQRHGSVVVELVPPQ